jgi:A/G-specific adenine glycosylase
MSSAHASDLHAPIAPALVSTVRDDLVRWFRANGRALPWRDSARNAAGLGEAERFWHTLLSEIMSQQTRIATVLPYWARWIERWPTIDAFARAEHADVLAMWQGLGYYRRATNLHRCAQAIVNDRAGVIPRTAVELEELPGIGPYTAGAIASAVFRESAAIVDGNVIRVVSRLRAIAAEPKRATKLVWQLSRQLVPTDVDDVYDFNQGLMDLGATVCTPKNPRCDVCPLSAHCLARRIVAGELAAPSGDIEDLCVVCTESPMAATAVTAFPLKAQKAKQRAEHIAVCVVHLAASDEFVLVQRPDSGILASMWEFPQVVVPLDSADDDRTAAIDAMLRERCAIDVQVQAAVIEKRTTAPAVSHELSHVRQTFLVERIVLGADARAALAASANVKIVARDELTSSAISQGNLKCLKAAEGGGGANAKQTKARRKPSTSTATTKEKESKTSTTTSSTTKRRRAASAISTAD